MQAEINIGTVGHVDHGKSTLVRQLTGVHPDTHSEEIKRGITIKLGYADATIYDEKGLLTTQPKDKNAAKALRHVSFVDAPGHETLMATVIAASSVMDGALFVIAANEKCPQPQTAEHLLILEAAQIKNVIVIQNKVDLVTKERAKAHYKEIKEFLKGTAYANAPVIPTAANAGLNLDAVLAAIQAHIPSQKPDGKKEFRMHVVRSFDVNKPGTAISKLAGGVLGGAVISGSLKKGDEIQIRPGVLKQKKNKEVYEELETDVLGLFAGKDALNEARPGGLIAVQTHLDPSLTKGDALVGCLVGKKGSLPETRYELTVQVTPMPRLENAFAQTLVINEPLVLGVGTATTVGFVQSANKKAVQLKLKKPVCLEKDELIAVMRRTDNRWRVFGVAKLVD